MAPEADISEVLGIWDEKTSIKLKKICEAKDIIFWGSQFYAKLAALILNFSEITVVDANPDFQGGDFVVPAGKSFQIENPEVLNDKKLENSVIILCMSKEAAHSLRQDLSKRLAIKQQFIIGLFDFISDRTTQGYPAVFAPQNLAITFLKFCCFG